ncbi:DUF1642 domain-containing protein [Lactococcus lactis]|uniref:DUF1642 domain-containing protein n=1 Tax=Lactococcus lactis TaxID=1358 RepID=UPI003D2F0D67
MTKNDYIEKITQNLEHLTKDELKDVSILTTAQLVVRSKFAERQQLEHEITNLTPKLKQQALPVVPECVAEWIEILKTKGLKPLKNPETYGKTGFTEEKLQNIVFWISEYQEDYMRAWLDGYTVEKPQLFYLREKNTNYYLNKSKNNGLELVPNPYFDEDNQFTKQEIGSMQTGSYEQIEVAE